jgi:hypothetical protein
MIPRWPVRMHYPRSILFGLSIGIMYKKSPPWFIESVLLFLFILYWVNMVEMKFFAIFSVLGLVSANSHPAPILTGKSVTTSLSSFNLTTGAACACQKLSRTFKESFIPTVQTILLKRLTPTGKFGPTFPLPAFPSCNSKWSRASPRDLQLLWRPICSPWWRTHVCKYTNLSLI